MKVKIQFKTGNAAFKDGFESEVRRMTDKAFEAIVEIGDTKGKHKRTLLDTNGNSVGTITINP